MNRPARYKNLLFLCVPLLALFGFDAANGATISAWITYWDLTKSAEIFHNHFLGTINTIHSFVYVFDENARIVNACKDKTVYAKALQVLKNGKANVIPTITNDIQYSDGKRKLKDTAIVSRILTDDTLRQQHLQQILAITEELQAPGVDIDYENMDIRDKDLFSRFIEELAAALHARNKTLTVTVQHKTRSRQRAGAEAIDWKEVSRHADRIVVMCYNYSSRLGKPGPICPPFWLKDIIRFARSQIPQEKICIALPLHGYDWSKEQTVSVNIKTAQALIDKYNAALQWDTHSASPYFTYYTNGVRHQVWFENDKSISEKIKIIKRYKISHLAVWHLGILDPSLTEPLQEFSY